MARRIIQAGLALAALLAPAVPAAAQDQAIVLNLGYFTVRGEDGRAAGDVLNADRCIDTTFACEPLLFDVGDFNNATFGAEYLFGIGDYLEAGVGVNYYRRTVNSIYDLVTRPDGSEIEQDLRLRIVPITGTLRLIPTGRRAAIQPYIGAGIAALSWRYSETGEFVDPFDFTIFRASFSANGTEVAPVILGGVRGRVADTLLVGGEVRFQRAEGDLPVDDFLGDTIDLGGTSYLFTVGWMF
jgi:opacity protein-like surface antigen